MREAPSQLAPLQRETLPVCPEDPAWTCLPLPRLLPPVPISLPFLTHCDVLFKKFFLILKINATSSGRALLTAISEVTVLTLHPPLSLSPDPCFSLKCF